MKLGAQLFSLRGQMQTEEDIRRGLARLSEMGYSCVQVSGIASIPAEHLREISHSSGLPVVCTHNPIGRILEETDELIREHKIIGCPVIGLGCMPPEYRENEEGFLRFIDDLKKPVAKILDSGLHFAYHNHHFELEKRQKDGTPLYDLLLSHCPDWQFILDVYWTAYAGFDPLSYIARLAPERLPNLHIKDMAGDEKRSICACGRGITDLRAIVETCRAHGVKHLLVEQDNATDAPDPFGEMACSLQTLKALL